MTPTSLIPNWSHTPTSGFLMVTNGNRAFYHALKWDTGAGGDQRETPVGERTVKEQDIQKFLLKAPCGQQEVHYHSEVSQDIT